MIWMMTTSAALFTTPEEEPLAPLERSWGGQEVCDARATLVAAGARVVHPSDPDEVDDPTALLMHNLHVLEAWEQVEGCATVARAIDGTFEMFSAGQVLLAAARSKLKQDPRRAAEHALDAFAMGNDVAAGPLVATMVGRGLHSQALDVLGEVWPALSPADQARMGAQLRAIHAARPSVDLEAERAMARSIASFYLLEGTCLDAHEEALGYAERALSAGNPGLLEDSRTPSLSQWLTGCGTGIESVTAQYLEDEVTLGREVVALAG